jgi:exonuclease SbcC
MIPIQLTLQNFMSYGSEGASLSFDELHVACLSGDNGNGKSALLDAMTWALWGKTRASSAGGVTEDDLIRVGAEEAEVRLEFELNEQRYRVVKKRRRGKSSGSEWQLTQKDSNGAYVPIGGTSQRETGRLIVQLLSMEYETFLNSAYLQQGHADEFTRQTPAKRKGILSEILDLERYDRLETKAKDRFKERKELAEEFEREIKLLDAQIAHLPDYRAQLEETRIALASMETQVAVQVKVVESLRNRRSELDSLATRVADANAVYLKMEADVAQRERERCDKMTRIKRTQAILDQREAILGDSMKMQSARRRREQIEPEIEAYNRSHSELQNVIGAIDVEKTELQGKLNLLEDRLSSMERSQRELSRVDAQIVVLAEALTAEPEKERTWSSAQADVQAAQEAFAELRARNDKIKADLIEVEEVLELLSHPQATCPVCESDLSGKKHTSVVSRQEARRARLQQEQEVLKRDGAQKKSALTAAQEAVRVLEIQRSDLIVKRSQLAQVTERRSALQLEAAGVESLRKEVAHLRLQLERGDFAAPKRAHRQRLEKELERLGLIKSECEAIDQTLRQLDGIQKRVQELEQAESSLEQEGADLARIEKEIALRQKECKEQHAKIEALTTKLSHFEQVKREEGLAEAELDRMQRELNSLHVMAGSYLNYIAGCQKAVEERKQRNEAFKKVDEERRTYQALASAFGKKGVQALIIENAIPELEEEANGLLSRMTEGAMQIRFETTRSAKSSGNEIETLDIKITDDAGTRPYELFSGGESFRVNFAIRLALSRLLARRSGAKLQTLIMDEGFGTQDGKGREKLVEVIDTIKDDFEKILVITHVEELKDSFSQRIEVTKDAQGSHIHVL